MPDPRLLTEEELARIGREQRHANATTHPPGDSWLRGYSADVAALLGHIAALSERLAESDRKLNQERSQRARFVQAKTGELKRQRDEAVTALRRGWETLPQFTLCRETGEQAESGECPFHRGDACLFQYVQVAALRRLVPAAEGTAG